MTGRMLLPVALAAAGGVSAGLAFLLWPRRLTATEWASHRRLVGGAAPLGRTRSRRGRLRLPDGISGVISMPAGLGRDLALLRLRESGLPSTEADLRRLLWQGAVIAALAGLALGGAIQVLGVIPGSPPVAVVLPLLTGVTAPVLLIRFVRRRAARAREELARALPRVLTGARMLMESGGVTPERALTEVAALYFDPATQLLQEAGRVRDVRLATIDEALDTVAATYGVEGLHRLADAFRIGRQYGTGMSGVLSDFADGLTRQAEVAEETRITTAPIKLVYPGLAFFFTPFFLLILYLFVAPLTQVLNR